ncbi:DUF2845 domain-containing protein [Rhodanobacter ginsengisoli]|uniref:DUF2845 domain-containing protein n=1 Tax=Rhodanobacter ginsengisoli TaxID=418646 RepID=A0ABW0QI63_9GAMM
MRMCLVVALFVFSAAGQASSTLRVGNQVLTAGDSRERVTELLGKPSSKSHKHSSRNSHGSRRGGVRVLERNPGGERWRYRRGDHVTVVTLVDGRVTDIEDERL